ncbi:hypothetical protein RIF29_09263 [Crotalaria pallida]|uniref:Uncharacterized protein n=1 Tax=Crotalaria pallida TaxID=3830 RepID=A0AAN9FRM6_CROPI
MRRERRNCDGGGERRGEEKKNEGSVLIKEGEEENVRGEEEHGRGGKFCIYWVLIWIPSCVVVGWCMGKEMDLNFLLFKTVTLFITVLVVAFMMQLCDFFSLPLEIGLLEFYSMLKEKLHAKEAEINQIQAISQKNPKLSSSRSVWDNLARVKELSEAAKRDDVLAKSKVFVFYLTFIDEKSENLRKLKPIDHRREAFSV